MKISKKKYKKALELIQRKDVSDALKIIRKYEELELIKEEEKHIKKVNENRKRGCSHPNAYVSSFHGNGLPDYYWCPDCEQYC